MSHTKVLLFTAETPQQEKEAIEALKKIEGLKIEYLENVGETVVAGVVGLYLAGAIAKSIVGE